ncbi:SDR family oxidoreductase [Rhizobium miluonense]|uniref:NAD(P)-dependent dehydrogenase, short-chain alcohol dehydrogenase family n=1 Tax=Rhizobium miluonense TaxID=411945 RepID=A0A1C3UG40_9HYPH|nr:SDR family oxidoreductase [Rhizobium miluonense]SCB14440.1 NAD(P)-dependent dehydrogenase, short-chain alcohol dehydrogenase family [Rhizobium miluonense]
MTSSTANSSPRPQELGAVLVTGASRGLGKALAELYAGDGWRVLACARQQLPGAAASMLPYPLDVSDAVSIETLGKILEGTAIDIVINNAAVRGDTGGLMSLRADDFMEVMRINALAPLLVAQALKPNLLAGRRKLLVNISSRAGSLAEGTLDDDDGDYAYRCSKAALNMATVKLAQDFQREGIAVISLHPGWIRTDMGGPDAVVDIAQSAQGLKGLIDTATMADSGSFRAYDGRTVSW